MSSFQKLRQRALHYAFDDSSDRLKLFHLTSSIFSKQLHSVGPGLTNQYTRDMLQGIVNGQIISPNINRIWPYWVYQQLSPKSDLFNTAGLPNAHINSTCRNWTLIGFPNATEKPIVDPRGLLTPHPYGWSLDIWVANSSKVISPATISSAIQEMSVQAPIITTRTDMNHIQLSTEVFFKYFSNKDNVLFQKTTVTNQSSKAVKFSVFYAICPYNPEGISPIERIEYLTNQTFVVNKDIGLILDQPPDNVVCLTHQDSDIQSHIGKWEMIMKSHCPDQMASAYAEYRLHLDPGESTEFHATIPFVTHNPIPPFLSQPFTPKLKSRLNTTIDTYSSLHYTTEIKQCIKDWETLSGPISSIQLGNASLQTLIEQNTMHLQTFIGKQILSYSKTDYTSSHFRDHLNMLFSLNRMNAFQLGERILQLMIKHSKSLYQYRQLSNPYQLECLCLFTLLLDDYFTLTQNFNFIDTHFLFIEKAADLLIRYAKTLTHSYKQHSIFKHSLHYQSTTIDSETMIATLWVHRTIKSIIKLCFILEKEDRLNQLNQIHQKLDHYLSHQLETLSAQSHLFSHSQSKGSHPFIPALVGLYPLNVIPNDHPLTDQLLSHIESTATVKGCYYNYSSTPGIGLTQNCQLAQIYMHRSADQFNTIFNFITAHALGTGSWPETIHPISQHGMTGDGHHGLACGEFLRLVRNCLVLEDQHSLCLCPNVPKDWVSNPSEHLLSVSSLPTYFGMVGFTITPKRNQLILDVSTDLHTKPKHLKFRWHQPIHSIKYGDHTEKVNSHEVILPLQHSSFTITLQS